MEYPFFDLAVIILCLVMSAFFSSSETALFALKKADLHRFSKKPDNTAEHRIYGMMLEPDKILITILIGNLFVNIVVTSISTNLFLRIWPSYGHIVSTAVMTSIIVLFCEISPKIIAFGSAEFVAKKTNRLLGFFHALFTPLRFLMLIFSNFVIRIFKLKVSSGNITSDELEHAVEIGEAEGIINRDESVFIRNVLLFSKKEASNAMFPRSRAVFLREDDSVETAIEAFIKHGMVRAPVYRDDYDHIIGYVDSKDIMPEFMGYRKEKKIKRFIRPISFYPSTKELNELLNDMISTGSQIAVLVDEYGGVDGIITLNRILQELMGKGFARAESGKKEISASCSIVSGEMQISDFNFKFEDGIESGVLDSLGGYIIEKLGHFPKRGESVETDMHILKVRKISGNRVVSVEVKRRG